MAFRKRGQTLAVEAAAGRLAGANLALATAGSPRHLSGLTAAPSGEDPTSVAEGSGSNLRPQVTWAATNTGAAPVEIVSSGDVFIGPFSASATITHVALLVSAGPVVSGAVLSVATVTPRSVVTGDRLRFPSGTIKITVS